jgi:hypothetical protein
LDLVRQRFRGDFWGYFQSSSIQIRRKGKIAVKIAITIGGALIAGNVVVPSLYFMILWLTFQSHGRYHTWNEEYGECFVTVGTFAVGWAELQTQTLIAICVKDVREIGIATGLGGSVRSAVSSVASAIYIAVLANRLTTLFQHRLCLPLLVLACHKLRSLHISKRLRLEQ